MYETYDIVEGENKRTPYGEAFLLSIHRQDMEPMSFRELWNVFNRHCPGRWALQAFPPKGQPLDQANKYHLWVFDSEPEGLELMRS